MRRLILMIPLVLIASCRSSRVVEERMVVHDTVTVEHASTAVVHDTVTVAQWQDAVTHQVALDTAGRVRTVTRVVYRSHTDATRGFTSQHTDSTALRKTTHADARSSTREMPAGEKPIPIYYYVLSFFMLTSAGFVAGRVSKGRKRSA